MLFYATFRLYNLLVVYSIGYKLFFNFLLEIWQGILFLKIRNVPILGYDICLCSLCHKCIYRYAKFTLY